MRRRFPTVFGGRPTLSATLPRRPPPEPEREPVPPHEPLQVPDLVGLPSTDARRLVRAAHLAVTVEERTASEGSWGRVLEQEPAPGTLGAPDGIVILTVGIRPRVAVPDVRGRDEAEALSTLREAGLGAARRAVRQSDRVPEGCVVRTRPRAGAEVSVGTGISYVVAASAPETGAGARKRDRHPARAMRLADGSFVLPSKGADGPRR